MTHAACSLPCRHLPRPLTPSQRCCLQTALLAAALPARFQHSRAWELAYSTSRHGISLQTLQRRAAGASPSVLVVKGSGGEGMSMGGMGGGQGLGR